MAVSMSATLQVVTSPVIVNQPAQFILTVTNSGATATNLNTVSPKVLASNGQVIPPGAYTIGSIAVTPETAVAQLAGSQLNIQVLGSSSITLGFAVIFFGPNIATNNFPAMNYFVSADMLTSDGSSFSVSAPQVVSVGQPFLGQNLPPGSINASLIPGSSLYWFFA